MMTRLLHQYTLGHYFVRPFITLPKYLLVESELSIRAPTQANSYAKAERLKPIPLFLAGHLDRIRDSVFYKAEKIIISPFHREYFDLYPLCVCHFRDRELLARASLVIGLKMNDHFRCLQGIMAR